MVKIRSKVYVTSYVDALNVLVCTRDELRDRLRSLYGLDAVQSDSVSTWEATDDGWVRATWGSGCGEMLADPPDAVLRLHETIARAQNLACETANVFVAEHNEPIDPDATDWDAEAWAVDRHTLAVDERLVVDGRDALWLVYQDALVCETERLCAARAA